jgi:hypothetical protein
VGAGAAERTSCLQSGRYSAWAMLPADFALVNLELGSLELFFPGLSLNCDPSTLSFPNNYYYSQTQQEAYFSLPRQWCHSEQQKEGARIYKRFRTSYSGSF